MDVVGAGDGAGGSGGASAGGGGGGSGTATPMEEEGPLGVFPGWARLRHDPQLNDDDTSDWREVDTPPVLQSSKPIRLKQFGPRLFIVLDSEAIPPLAEFMRSRNRWNRFKAFRGTAEKPGQCLLKAKGGLYVTDHAGLVYLLADRNSGKAGTSNPFDHHRLQDWILWVGSYLVVNHLMPESAAQSVVRKRPTPASRLDPQSSAKQSRSIRRSGRLHPQPCAQSNITDTAPSSAKARPAACSAKPRPRPQSAWLVPRRGHALRARALAPSTPAAPGDTGGRRYPSPRPGASATAGRAAARTSGRLQRHPSPRCAVRLAAVQPSMRRAPLPRGDLQHRLRLQPRRGPSRPRAARQPPSSRGAPPAEQHPLKVVSSSSSCAQCVAESAYREPWAPLFDRLARREGRARGGGQPGGGARPTAALGSCRAERS